MWIIVYHHRHGIDAWLEMKTPDLDKIAADLDDFEPDREEWLEVIAPELPPIIKAAPELLAALDDLMGWVDLGTIQHTMTKMGESSIYNRTIRQARAAIAKATE
jgi:hypothetical protein